MGIMKRIFSGEWLFSRRMKRKIEQGQATAKRLDKALTKHPRQFFPWTRRQATLARQSVPHFGSKQEQKRFNRDFGLK